MPAAPRGAMGADVFVTFPESMPPSWSEARKSEGTCFNFREFYGAKKFYGATSTQGIRDPSSRFRRRTIGKSIYMEINKFD